MENTYVITYTQEVTELFTGTLDELTDYVNSLHATKTITEMEVHDET